MGGGDGTCLQMQTATDYYDVSAIRSGSLCPKLRGAMQDLFVVGPSLRMHSLWKQEPTPGIGGCSFAFALSRNIDAMAARFVRAAA